MTPAPVDVRGLFDLTGQRAVVTGCRTGIGAAVAEALAAAGADVVGASSRLEPGGSDVEVRVRRHGRAFEPHAVDLADRGAVMAFAAELTGSRQPVDVLVHNAGIAVRSPAVEHDDATWDRVLAVNLDAAFVLAREVGRTMVARGRGKIIVTASVLSYQGGFGVASYAASKHAVAGMVKALANEWAPHGVNCNAIAPGYVATALTEPLRDDPVRSRQILERIPAGRWGAPEDLAGAAVFLASRASDYVHGTVLAVDGGWLAR